MSYFNRTVTQKNLIFIYMELLNNRLCVAAGLAVLLTATSCKHDPPKPTGIDPASTQYPLEVAKIIVGKCATTGCHNEASYSFAGGLRLDDWKYMFDGGGTGAVTVAYSPENSPLLYFLNPGADVYDVLSVKPTMPYNESPLSREEYNTIKDWITNGAPDKNGNIPFASNAATRQKAYLTQQGCDLVAVIDAEKKVVMRYIKVGKDPNKIETAHFVQVDKQGRYAYVCFTTGNIIQKIDCNTDQVIGEMPLAGGQNLGENYNIVQVSDDGSLLIASQLADNGNITFGNATTMTRIENLAILAQPHGIAYNSAFDTFYITGQKGNVVYLLDRNRNTKQVSINGLPTTTQSTPGVTPDPHEIIMSPDKSKYFLTCENTNEVRVMDRVTNTVLKAIPTGLKPQELAISTTKPYVFVTCMEDVSRTSALYKGSVYVIDYNTLDVVKRIDGEFSQPHGVAVDDRNGMFYISSANIDSDGPAPHHVSNCNGRNGFYQVYNLNTLNRADRKTYEVPPSPYSMQMRFR